MVRFGKCLVEPSYTRPPAYTGGLSSKDLAYYSWKCVICQNDVAVSLNDSAVLASYEALSNEMGLSAAEIQEVKDKFEIGIVGASKDGGGPCFKHLRCAYCAQPYLVYLGVREPLNSFFSITVQAVCQLLEE